MMLNTRHKPRLLHLYFLYQGLRRRIEIVRRHNDRLSLRNTLHLVRCDWKRVVRVTVLFSGLCLPGNVIVGMIEKNGVENRNG